MRKTNKMKKHSIKKQLAVIIIGLITGTLLLCLAINSLFLQTFYENKRMNALLETYELLNTTSATGDMSTDEFSIELEKKSTAFNIMGVVEDSNAELLGTFGNDSKTLQRLLWDRLYMPVMKSQIISQNENYTIQKVEDAKTKTEYMEMLGWLDGGQTFYIRTPLENIRESVQIANQFLLYVGIIAIGCSSILIWFASKKVTQPIRELADISERMTRLDFDAKYSGKWKNEFSLLGDNMNTMSESLETTIRELKTANNELQKDIEKKNKMDEIRTEFLSNVSHELKTPIALIQGYAEGLQADINDDAQSREFYCEVIMDEAGKMNTLVKKLMTLNELEFGNDMVKMERFDIVTLIKNYVQSAGLLAKQNGIDVHMAEYEPIYVWGDEFKIEEVFTNYYSNAVNHCAGEKAIDVRLEQMDRKVRVTVFNTGEKIPEESLPYIWDKFYKVDKARTREYGGSGVGLSIVKAIMDSMNQQYGVVNFENGVAFWFELETVENGDMNGQKAADNVENATGKE